MEPCEVTLTVPLTLTLRLGDGPTGATRFERLTSGVAEAAARPVRTIRGIEAMTLAFWIFPFPYRH